MCAACLYVACRFNKNPTMLIDFADLLQTDVYRFRFPHTQMEFGLCLHETEHGAQVGLSPRTHLQPEGEADRPVAVH